MLSKKQITGASRKGRIHIWLKQLSKMRGIKCEQVFLDAWQLRILTVFHFIRRFVVLFQKLPHNRTARGDGLVSNVSCVGNEDEYFLSTSDKSLGVFSSIDTFLTILHLFSAMTMSTIFVSIRSCAENHFWMIVVSLPTIQQTDHPIVVVEFQRSGLSSAHHRWKPLVRYAGM